MLLEDFDVDPISGQLRATVDPDRRVFRCWPGVQVGQCVALFFDGRVGVADASDRVALPAIGIASQILSATHCAVQTSGVVLGLSQLTPGRAHYVGAAGALASAIPTPNVGERVYLQQMGVALTEAEFLLRPWPFLIRRTQ